MSLPTRKNGTSAVSAIGYGAMGLSGMYSKPIPDEERLKVFKIVLSLLFVFQDLTL
jgi:aryl-alcohol dehydrogenase-like predicted oxidoreductase